MAEPKIPARVQIGDRILKAEVNASLEKAPYTSMVLNIGEDGQTEEIKLVDVQAEERERQLSDLLFQGKTTKTITIGNKTAVVLETFDGKSMLELDSTSGEIRPPDDALRKWDLDYEMVRTIAKGIKTFDGQSIGNTRAEREAFVLKLPWTVILYLGGQWNRFMAELAVLMEPDIVGDLIRK